MFEIGIGYKVNGCLTKIYDGVNSSSEYVKISSGHYTINDNVNFKHGL